MAKFIVNQPQTYSLGSGSAYSPLGAVPPAAATPKMGVPAPADAYNPMNNFFRAFGITGAPPNVAQPAAAMPPGATPPGSPAPAHTPISAYGINDTGRTTPFAPNPSFANMTTLGAGAAPTYADGSGGVGQSPGGNGRSFEGLLGMLFGQGNGQQQPYEAALRERPSDIQSLVSSVSQGRAGPNPGGFLGGLFDKKG